MNKTYTLTKVLLKSNLSNWGKRGRKKGKQLSSILLAIIMIIALMPFMFALSSFVSGLYDILAPIQQEGILLGMGMATISTVVFIFGIFYIINVFYFSQDIEQLLPLPLKPTQIITAKFFVTLLYEYLTALIFLMPVLIVYGIKSGGGVLYYLYGFLVFLALPVVPLVLASLLAMILMRFVNIGINKDRFRMIGGVLALVFALGFNFVAQRYAGGKMNPEEMQELIMSGNNSFLGMVTSLFPSAKFGALALLNGATAQGFLYLLLFLALAGVSYALFLFFGQRLYFAGVIGISETGAKRIRITQEELVQKTKRSSLFSALFWKELKMLLRTPVYFTNYILMGFLWPVLFLIMMLAKPGSIENLTDLKSMILPGIETGIALAIAVVVVLFTSGTSNPSVTAISREGLSLFVYKYLPIPYSKMFQGKMIASMLVTSISTILLLAVSIWVLGLPPLFVVLIAALSFQGILLNSILGILIDLYFPKLYWDSEQKVVKQNMNPVLLTISSFLFAGVLLPIAIIFKFGLWPIFIGLFLFLTLCNFLFYRLLMTKGIRWMEQIEP